MVKPYKDLSFHEHDKCDDGVLGLDSLEYVSQQVTSYLILLPTT